VNFANHLDTVGGLRFSADYPYTIAKLLGVVKGPKMLTMFTVGTCGNINHIDVELKTRQKGHEEAARIGACLARAVLKTYSHLEPVEPGPVTVRRAAVGLPVVKVTLDEVAKARKLAQTFGTSNAPSFYKQVHAFKVLAAEKQKGKPFEAEVQVIALGRQVAWVGLPGEVFVELGKAIKLASPFPYTIISELTNDKVQDYVPDFKAYPEGAYEVISTPVAVGGGEALVATAVRMLVDARGPYPPAHR
jgi:hypothetical protein